MPHPLHRLFGKCDFQPFELTEDYLPVKHETTSNTITDQLVPPTLRSDGPKVWYIGYRCAKCGQPGYKMGPLL